MENSKLMIYSENKNRSDGSELDWHHLKSDRNRNATNAKRKSNRLT